MNIRGRLFLQGALLPSCALAALVLGGGVLLRRALLQSVDESLTAQAAVEAASLFDLAESPHLHLASSPLRHQVEDFVPSRAVYGPDGARLVAEEGTAPLEERLEPGDAQGDERPRIRTISRDARALRELRLVVRSPGGERYVLVLRAGLARIEHAVDTYYRVLGLGALLITALFVLVQSRLSAWWSDRIQNMIRHTRRLEAGDLSSRPDSDPYEDEIGELTAAIARASARLEAARQAQDRLVADAAHELRSPLAAMRAEIDVTLRRPREPEVLRETLEELREEVLRLDALTTGLLDLARLANDAWRMEQGDLRAVLDASIEAHRTRMEARGVRVEVEAPAWLEARFDARALRQAIDNLVSNAVKFSPDGGVVRVRLTSEAARWRLEVDDEGPGIPEQERDAVFEPFHRVDARIPGSGLGLAIVRDIARGHRGRAWAEDAPRGAAMMFEAPLAGA